MLIFDQTLSLRSVRATQDIVNGLSGYEHLLLLRARVQFPAPISGSSQPLVAPVHRYVHSHGAPAYTQVYIHICIKNF